MKKSRLERRTPLRSSGRIAPVARVKAEATRIYGTDARVDWMHEHSCLVCHRMPVEIAHAKNGGTGRKADAALTVALCHDCHAGLHQHGSKTFAAAHEEMLMGLSLVQWAARYERAWQRFQAQPEPLSSVVPRVVADLLTEEEPKCGT